MAINSIYLRPVKDISVGHTLYPTSSTDGYLLIDDETQDASSTYLGSSAADANTTSTLTSSFMLSGNIPVYEKINIRDAKIVYRIYANSYCSNCSMSFTVSVNGLSFTSSSISVATYTNYDAENTDITFGSEDVVNVINNYLASNGGSFPEITISFTTSHTGSSKGAGTLNITQLYVELIYDICTNRKISGQWKNALVGYQKVNGEWTKINNSRSILSFGAARLGHEQVAIDRIESTCTETGLTKGYRCSICGEIIKPQIVIDAKGHTSSVIEGTEPTCSFTGLTDGVGCSVCNEILVEQEIIPPTGDAGPHDYTVSGIYNVCADCGYIENFGRSSLKRDNVLTLSYADNVNPSATTVGNYALFGGGFEGNSATNICADTVDAYDASLTRTTPTPLSIARGGLSATTVGNYALFGGGHNQYNDNEIYYDTVDAYDTSLTRTTPTTLFNTVSSTSATTVGNYALFGGGNYRSEGVNYLVRRINAYDTSLTRTFKQLSIEKNAFAATTVGNYALFGGGLIPNSGDSLYTDTVDAYDASLTKTTPTPLSIARGNLSATTVGNYALFGGGSIRFNNNDGASGIYDTVDAYDTSLTRTIPTPLNKEIFSHAATTVGNYALFGGGIDSDSSSSSVFVYKLDFS